MKIEEVPQSIIDKEINMFCKMSDKHIEIWEKAEQLENGFGLSITCSNEKEATSLSNSLRSRVYGKKLPYQVALIKPKSTVYIKKRKPYEFAAGEKKERGPRGPYKKRIDIPQEDLV
jgi:hypothetical protein